MSTPKHTDLVCPRCGKPRSLKHRPQGRKTPMCQPCAVAVADKRHHIAARFLLGGETIDELLAELTAND